MIRWLFISICFLVSGASFAQFLPNNGQAFQFMSLYNPAFTGVENFADLKLSYRYQWSGFGSNAPKFMNLGFNTRLKQPLDLTYNAPRSSHTTAIAPANYPTAKTIIHGIGANVFAESYGPVSRIGLGVNYSINYALSKRLRMAAGIGVIYENQKINTSDLTFENPDEVPEEFLNSTSQTLLSARAGILFYSKSFYLGVSYLPVWSTVIQSASDEPQYTVYRGSVQTGVSIPLTAEFILKPSVVALLRQDNQLQFDYSLKAFIRERLWFGVSYRDIESVIPMVGFTISDVLSASYSYELSTSGFKQFSDSSHELVLSLRINNFKRLKQYTW